MTSEAPPFHASAADPAAGRGAATTLIRKTMVGVALLAYTAFGTEAYFRVFDPQPLMPRYVTGTAWGVRGNIPNSRYENHTAEVDVQYRINDQGLRADRHYPFSKPSGTCRIGVYGDSFFFGIELDASDTFESQLEGKLREAGYRTEVMNFAVGGFGTAEMLQTLEGFGLRFHPDIVLFSWDNSDLLDNVRSGLFRVDEGQLRRANAQYLPGVKTSDWLMQFRSYRFIADHSEFYSFARERIEYLVKRQQRRADRDDAAGKPGTAEKRPEVAQRGDSVAEDPNVEQKRRAADLASALLLRADADARANGAAFYLVELPWKVSRTDFTSSVDDLPTGTQAAIHIVRTAGALSKAARPDLELYFESGQGHLTPTGESVLVDETVKNIVSARQMSACTIAAQRR